MQVLPVSDQTHAGRAQPIFEAAPETTDPPSRQGARDGPRGAEPFLDLNAETGRSDSLEVTLLRSELRKIQQREQRSAALRRRVRVSYGSHGRPTLTVFGPTPLDGSPAEASVELLPRGRLTGLLLGVQEEGWALDFDQPPGVDRSPETIVGSMTAMLHAAYPGIRNGDAAAIENASEAISDVLVNVLTPAKHARGARGVEVAVRTVLRRVWDKVGSSACSPGPAAARP